MPTAGRPHHAHDTPATAAMDASASGGGDIRSAADGAEVTAAVTVRIETGRRPADYPAPSSGRKRGVACTCQTSGPTPAKRRRLGLDEMTAWEACWAAGPAEGTRSRTAARARLAAAAAQETAASTSLSSSPPLQLTTPGSPSPRMLQPMPGPSSPSTPPILQPATSSPTPPPQLAPSTSTPSSPTTLKMRNLPSPPPPLPELRTWVTMTGLDAVNVMWDLATPATGSVDALHRYELTVQWISRKDPSKSVRTTRPLHYSAAYPLPRCVPMRDFPRGNIYFVVLRGLAADGRSTSSCLQRLPI